MALAQSLQPPSARREGCHRRASRLPCRSTRGRSRYELISMPRRVASFAASWNRLDGPGTGSVAL